MTTTPGHTCPVCETHPLDHHHTVCHHCVTTLRNHLTNLPDQMADLTAAITRQLNFGPQYRNGARSTTTPLPINLTASETGYVARTTILTWAHHIATDNNHPTPTTWAGIGTYLHQTAHHTATKAHGPDAISELTHALRTITRTIDRPADRTYAGPCTATDCGGELYARTDRDTATCPRCGAQYNVKDRRAWLLEQSWDTLATGPDIARALAGETFGKKITVNLSTIRRWASKGPKQEPPKLPRRGRHNGQNLYRLGDVVMLATGTGTPQPEPDQNDTAA